MVDFFTFEVYTFVGTLFIQMWSILINLRVSYTIVVDFYTFEGKFTHLWEFIHMRVQQAPLLISHKFATWNFTPRNFNFNQQMNFQLNPRKITEISDVLKNISKVINTKYNKCSKCSSSPQLLAWQSLGANSNKFHVELTFTYKKYCYRFIQLFTMVNLNLVNSNFL